MLTGGLAEYAELFPDHVEGVPLPRRPADPTKKLTRDVYKGASGLATSGAKSVKSAAMRSRRDTTSDASSVTSTLSVAETVISKAVARKARVQGGANYR